MPTWLEYCKYCKRKHLVSLRKCPTCNTYETPQPVSVNVANHCGANYSCDGCIEYRKHQY
jgi:hypothetical protein